jgi:hypothetical protein
MRKWEEIQMVTKRRVAGFFGCAVSAAAALACGGRAWGTTYTWSTTAATGNWGTATNWTPGMPVSASTTTLVFGASQTVALTDNITGTFGLNSLVFSSGDSAYTISPSGAQILQFTNNGATLPTILNNGTSSQTITVATNLAANLTLGGTGTGTVFLDGNLSAQATVGITVTGSNYDIGGSGQGTFTGLTTVSGGTLTLDRANAIGGNATVSGGTVTVNAAGGIGGNVTVSGGNVTVTSSGTIGGNLTVNGGTVTLKNVSGLGASSTVTISGGGLAAPTGATVGTLVFDSGGLSGPGPYTLTGTSTYGLFFFLTGRFTGRFSISRGRAGMGFAFRTAGRSMPVRR